jgi:hypothetical protein
VTEDDVTRRPWRIGPPPIRGSGRTPPTHRILPRPAPEDPAAGFLWRLSVAGGGWQLGEVATVDRESLGCFDGSTPIEGG